jgi:multidrug efflux pump subunit AcrA (membrane-fusion protein)
MLKILTLIFYTSQALFLLFNVSGCDSNDSSLKASNASTVIGENVSLKTQLSPGTYTVLGSRVSGHTIIGGSVIPIQDVTLTAQLAGQVKYLTAREGDRFNNNTLLIAIDADKLQAQKQASLAQLQNAKSEVDNAEVQYQRELFSPQSRSLSKSGGMALPMLFDQLISQPMASALPGSIGGDSLLDRNADLYTAGTILKQARGHYLQAQSSLDEVNARLSDSRVNTPFPGVILEKMVEVGDTVQIGSPLLRYANLSQLQIEAQVPASIVKRLAANMIVPVKLGDAAYESNARVVQVFPTANSQRRTVTVKFDLPNDSGAIPGMYVEVFLPSKQRNQQAIPVIPISAVLFNSSLPSVKVLDSNNKVQLRMIRLGERLNKETVSVISGLDIGEKILTRP